MFFSFSFEHFLHKQPIMTYEPCDVINLVTYTPDKQVRQARLDYR